LNEGSLTDLRASFLFHDLTPGEEIGLV